MLWYVNKNMWQLSCTDKTIFNLISLLIVGTGLFAVLTKFNVPELKLTYYGHNPFAIKRDIINNVMTWLFTSLALSGLLIQILSIIFGHKLPERSYETSFYIIFTCVGIIASVVILVILGAIGKYIAKKMWWPKIIKSQMEGYKLSLEIINNNGWESRLLNKKNNYLPERQKEIEGRNFKQCEERINNIEKLLELPKLRDVSLSKRIERLKKYFEK